MLTQLHAIKQLIPSDCAYYTTGSEDDNEYVIYCQSDLDLTKALDLNPI